MERWYPLVQLTPAQTQLDADQVQKVDYVDYDAFGPDGGYEDGTGFVMFGEVWLLHAADDAVRLAMDAVDPGREG